jgi:hypothetical protein
VPDGAERNPIVNLKKFLLPNRQQQDPLVIAKRDHWTAGGQLHLDVIATRGDCFHPTIRLFDHATRS